MSSNRTFTFSCDSALGCLRYATVAQPDIGRARQALADALGWDVDGIGDLCDLCTDCQAAERVDR